MAGPELLSGAEVRLMQGLAQRVAATRLDLVNAEATYGELAGNRGKGHAAHGGTWPRRLWFSGGDLPDGFRFRTADELFLGCHAVGMHDPGAPLLPP